MSKSNPTELVHNSLGEQVQLIGNLKIQGDLRFDGHIEGDLEVSGKIVVGKSAIIKGHLKCNTGDILGSITGSIQVKELLCLRSSTNIEGDIYTKQLHIEPGATFNGKCMMGNKEAEVAAKPKK